MTPYQDVSSALPNWIELEPGENVLFHELPERRARLGAYVASLGLFEVWRRRTHFVVTNQRVATVRGLVSIDRQVIPLDRVERVTLRGRGRSVTVQVATVNGALGTQPFGPLSEDQARRLIEAVERARPTPA